MTARRGVLAVAPLVPSAHLGRDGRVADRMAAHRVGRHLLRTCISELGVTCTEALGPRGHAPVVPSGVVGSIAHASALAVAVAAHDDQLQAVGVDAEPAAPLPFELAATLLSAHELRQAAGLEDRLPAGVGATVLVTAKEAAVKCMAPWHVELPQVAVTPGDGAVLNARVHGAREGGENAGHRSSVAVVLRGRWQLLDSHVVTVLWRTR